MDDRKLLVEAMKHTQSIVNALDLPAKMHESTRLYLRWLSTQVIRAYNAKVSPWHEYTRHMRIIIEFKRKHNA